VGDEQVQGSERNGSDPAFGGEVVHQSPPLALDELVLYIDPPVAWRRLKSRPPEPLSSSMIGNQ